MGKGVKRNGKRVFTFTLDEEKEKDLIKWLEGQSTTSVSIQGLKLVRAGSGVVPTGSTSDDQTNQINRLLDLLANAQNTITGLLQQTPQVLNQIQQSSQIPQTKNEDEQAATSEKSEEVVEEEEEEFSKEQLEYAASRASRFDNFDPTEGF